MKIEANPCRTLSAMAGAWTAAGSMAAAVAIGVMLGTTPAGAHHSFAMFEFATTTQFKGTVKEFRWTNPHVVLLVAPTPAPGAAEEIWTLELTSPGNLTRIGWSRHSFKPGDRVELWFNPLRDGKHGGAFEKATLLDTGQVLTSNLRDAEKPGLK